MSRLSDLRTAIRAAQTAPEADVLAALQAEATISTETRHAATARGAEMVRDLRAAGDPGLMEAFLAEYGLSTEEGVALMCLAEALLRVPDAETIDALIEDKIAPSAWGEHLGKSSSSLVNASTWALMLTGKVLREDKDDGVASVLRGAVKRLGEPVIRRAVQAAIKEMGHQFVLGRDIDEAVKRGAARAKQGYTFSYDMLGEAALTAEDATHFYNAYAGAIARLAPQCKSDDIRQNPGISIKLSALHPRYEVAQRDRVMAELVPRALTLALAAKAAGMGLNVDAEEADRLDLSLDLIEAVLSDPSLAGWDGFGVVVQAYGKRASHVIDWLHTLAEKHDRRIMIRLVKGAYWDAEIKRAQVEGIDNFPVFTTKAATDVSYICCAKKLLGYAHRIYPQFATHNAHTVAAVQEMASDEAYEFQRLHGMGEGVHDALVQNGARSRIYAPVGPHRDLLAYLVRRLLENGANSSFVNQIVDEDVPAEVVAADPFEADLAARYVTNPSEIFAPRRNSAGFDLRDTDDLAEIDAAREPFALSRWSAGPLLAGKSVGGRDTVRVINPADHSDVVGQVAFGTAADVETALSAAAPWTMEAAARAAVLRRAADLYEEHFGELFALLAREAGKTQVDAVSELREAVDFLRFYADEGERQIGVARGIFACISPWNFPLAIFTGQLSAALAAGNAVVAKPAEATCLIACRAVQLLHEAGVPKSALQLVPGAGDVVGAALSTDERIAGMCFTGSTATALRINRSMAAAVAPDAPLIAETGGVNAMIVDSTALPEQAVRDVIASAFQSAGQRCSALRVLYLQEDVAQPFLQMLYGAMDELTVGKPWALSTDVGPVIDQRALDGIAAHIEAAASEGRVMKELKTPSRGWFIAPTVIRVNGIADLDREIFGPVLHVATFKADQLDAVVDAINATGYGLTFGMHSRIDDRVEQVTARLNVGNIYINRNQIGAVVGSQPFGGEGLSGTGPKAGGPHYVSRFTKADQTAVEFAQFEDGEADVAKVQEALNNLKPRESVLREVLLPGPTGESNRLSLLARGVVLCLGPDAKRQALIAEEAGCVPLTVVPGGDVDGVLAPEALTHLSGFDAVALWGDKPAQSAARIALAERNGPILPLITNAADMQERCVHERHICINTTAAGGDAALLAAG